MVDDVIDTITAGDGDDLRHIHDGTAADGDDAGILELGGVGDQRINHLIGRFLATVLVDSDYMGAVGDAGEERIMHHVHGDQQVVRPKIEFLRKFRDRGELVDHGANGELLHTNLLSTVRTHTAVCGGNTRIIEPNISPDMSGMFLACDRSRKSFRHA